MIDGTPVPKQRARVIGKGRGAFTPKKTKSAEERVAWMLALKANLRGNPIADRAIGVRLLFACPDRRRRDIDNLVKLIYDAANGVIWKDDAQIEEEHAKLIRADPDPRTEVVIYDIGPLK